MLVICTFPFVIEEDKKRDKYHDMNIMPFVSSSDEEDFTFNEFDFYE
jgi:hypothetical protein